eukprot:scaffold697_cov320-Prasinococcus_capsulatus_cf.AAC.8
MALRARRTRRRATHLVEELQRLRVLPRARQHHASARAHARQQPVEELRNAATGNAATRRAAQRSARGGRRAAHP